MKLRSAIAAAAVVGGLALVPAAGTASQASPNPHAHPARPLVNASVVSHRLAVPTVAADVSSAVSPGHILGPSRGHMTTMCGNAAGV